MNYLGLDDQGGHAFTLTREEFLLLDRGRSALPMIQGHRGNSDRYPENTMLGFQMGLAEGAGGIEADVRRTRDGVFVLSHDPTLQRTAGERGAIVDLTWPEIARLDASYRGRFGDAFAGRKDCRVPSLGLLLDWFADTSAVLILHIKALEGPALAALVDAVVARGILRRCHFFGPLETINQIKLHNPDCFTMNDGMPGPLEYRAVLRGAVANGHDVVSVNARCSPTDLETMVEEIHAAGKLVHASYLSADYRSGTQAMIDAGVDFILGNDVEAIVAVLRARGGEGRDGLPSRSRDCCTA